MVALWWHRCYDNDELQSLHTGSREGIAGSGSKSNYRICTSFKNDLTISITDYNKPRGGSFIAQPLRLQSRPTGDWHSESSVPIDIHGHFYRAQQLMGLSTND